jgi:type VI secretion system protein ImpF
MDNIQSLNPSLLDRLLDDNPGIQQEVTVTPQQSLRNLHQAVRRDLEVLLNTRRRCATYPAHLKELDKSLVNYGIPDFTGANLSSQESRSQFVRVIETVIRRYEPRFKSVRATLLDNVEPLDRTLRFRIDAVVYAEPAPENLVFDSSLEPVTGNVELKDVENG